MNELQDQDVATGPVEISLTDYASSKDHFSLIPQLIQLVGTDLAVKVIEVFGGVSIRFPESDEVQKWLRDYDIWRSLREGTATQTELADRYGIHQATVSRLYREVDREMVRLSSMLSAP